MGEVAGQAVHGSTWALKCKDGFKFANHPQEKLTLNCKYDYDHWNEWDIFADNFDYYGDCDESCYSKFPECIKFLSSGALSWRSNGCCWGTRPPRAHTKESYSEILQ